MAQPPELARQSAARGLRRAVEQFQQRTIRSTAVPSPRPSPQRTPSSSVATSAQRTPPTAPSSFRSPPSSGGSLGSRVARSASVLTTNHGFSRRASGLDEPCVTRRQSRLAKVLASAGLQRLPPEKAPNNDAAVSTAGWPTGVPNVSAHCQSYINESVDVSVVVADPPDENRQSACSMCGADDCRSAECDALSTTLPRRRRRRRRNTVRRDESRQRHARRSKDFRMGVACRRYQLATGTNFPLCGLCFQRTQANTRNCGSIQIWAAAAHRSFRGSTSRRLLSYSAGSAEALPKYPSMWSSSNVSIRPLRLLLRSMFRDICRRAQRYVRIRSCP